MLRIQPIVSICIILILIFFTVARSFCYVDEAALWQDTILKSPQKARPHNNLGHALKNAGRLDEAAHSFERAIELNPDYPDALNNLSTIYNSTGRKQDALDLLRRTLSLNPGHLQAKYNLALQYYEMGLFSDAVREYSQLIEISPYSKEAAFARQMLLLIQRNSPAQ